MTKNVMDRLKQLKIDQTISLKKKYDYISFFLMAGTIVTLFVANSKFSIVLLLLTTLALTSSNAIQTKIQFLEREMHEDIIAEHLQDE